MELVKGSVIPLEEDENYEFKMHVDMCEMRYFDDSKPRTRRAISRNINAFLNSGKGGIILLGIQDDGEVKGLSLSLQQKDHLMISLEDLLNRYVPPVPSNLYKMKYIPVVDKDQPSPSSPVIHKWNPPPPVNSSSMRAHLIRSTKPCWCFQNASCEANKGYGYTRYVVEISFLPTSPVTKPRLPPLKPLFVNEEGHCYIRKCASVWKMSYSEIILSTKEEVIKYDQVHEEA